MVRQWLEETHSARLELVRHFYLRFFDSELVSSPGQWRAAAAGALAVLGSLSTIFSQAYYHKYLILNGLSDPGPYRSAVVADVLVVIVLSMIVIGLLTTLQWPSLFPGLRDYLALASLPIRMQDIFIARFVALFIFAAQFTLVITATPSVVLATTITGRYGHATYLQIPAIFISASLAAMFVFFSLVAVQGVLLNMVPVQAFPRFSLVMQGMLMIALLCALPIAFSIPDAAGSLRPAWAVYVPPSWFLGLDQVLVGNREPLAVRLADLAFLGVAGAVTVAIGTYMWSYRRHRVRVLETPAAQATATRAWPRVFSSRFLSDPRELAVFAFVAKTLARSRHQRLLLTVFGGIALAIILDSFVSVALAPGFRGFSVSTPAIQQAAISAPLALSLFVLAGYRYLFRLPVEVRANWLFRITEPGNHAKLLAGVEKFLVVLAVIPVCALTLPLEIRLLGVTRGFVASTLCLLPSLVLMELALIAFEKIPFTSSYLPGRRPLIETVVYYGVGALLYVTGLSALVLWSTQRAGRSAVLFVALTGAWWRARRARLDSREVARLEFEEMPEPAVLTLGIEKD